MLVKTGQVITESVSSNFNTVVTGLLDGINSSLSGVVDTISSLISSVAASLSDSVDTIFDSVGNTIESIIDSSTTYVSDIYDNVTGYLKESIQNTTVFIDDLTGQVKVSIHEGIEYLKSTVDSVNDFIGEVYEDFDLVVSRIVGNVGNLFNEISTAVSGDIGSLTTFIFDKIDSILTTGLAHFDTYIDYIGGIVETVISDVSERIESVVEVGSKYLDIIGKEVEEILVSVNTVIMPAVTSILDIFSQITGVFSLENQAAILDKMTTFVRELVIDMKNPERNIEYIVARFVDPKNIWGLPGAVIGAILLLIVTAFSVIPSFITMGSSKNTAILYSVLSEFPITAYSTAEAVTLAARGFLEMSMAVENNLKHGYSRDKTDTLVDASRNRLDPERLMLLLRREYIDQNEFTTRLQRLGPYINSVT
jgi:phage-related protein